MPYNRAAAVNYARYFWDKICHDGHIASKTGYPTRANNVQLVPGLPFSHIGHIDDEEDCTHFLSCCVGNGIGMTTARGPLMGASVPIPIPVTGGGLPISSPFSPQGVYGETWAPSLVKALRNLGAKVVGREFSVKNYVGDAIKALEPGDVLAYASKDHPLKYEHMCLIVARGGKVACHTRSRFGNDYDEVGLYYPWVTLLKMP